MEMEAAYTTLTIQVPKIWVTVSNTGETHFKVTAVYLSKPGQPNPRKIPSGALVQSSGSEKLHVTGELINALSDGMPKLKKIFDHYQVEVAVECQGQGDAGPTTSDPKTFNVEIKRTGDEKCLGVKISPHSQ